LPQSPPSISKDAGGDSIMTTTEMLQRFGHNRVAFAPARSQIDGVWRIKFVFDGSRDLLVDMIMAAKVAQELRKDGERLFATRIEIAVEQARRSAVSERAA
jgi:hypothetical protein